MKHKKNEDLEKVARKTASEWLYTHAAKILTPVLALVIGWGGYEAYRIYSLSNEQKIVEALYVHVSAFIKAEDEAYESAQKALIEKAPKKSKTDKTPPPTVKRDKDFFNTHLLEKANALDEKIRKNSSSAGSLRAAIFLSDKYIEYGLPEKANELLTTTSSIQSSNVLAGLLRMKTAGVKSSQKDCGSAVKLYNEVAAEARWDFLHAQALLRSAACYIQLGNKDEARAKISKILADYKDSSAAQSARIYQRVLMLNLEEGK